MEGGRWAASRDDVPRWNALAGGVLGVDVIMLLKGLRLRLVGRVGLEEDRSLRRCSRKGAVRDSPEGSWGAPWRWQRSLHPYRGQIVAEGRAFLQVGAAAGAANRLVLPPPRPPRPCLLPGTRLHPRPGQAGGRSCQM